MLGVVELRVASIVATVVTVIWVASGYPLAPPLQAIRNSALLRREAAKLYPTICKSNKKVI